MSDPLSEARPPIFPAEWLIEKSENGETQMNNEMIDFDTMKLLYVMQDEMHDIQRRLTILDRKIKELDNPTKFKHKFLNTDEMVDFLKSKNPDPFE
jgi:hypothetical protein